MGFRRRELRDLRRAGLLHDIGKLGVSNMILDKPGKLDEREWAQMRRHPELTARILERVKAFRDLADVASSHHERLDGGGYHRGLGAGQLSTAARILAVADVCEALSAERPYRAAMEREQMLAIMRRDADAGGLCKVCFEALEVSLDLGTATLAAPSRPASTTA
jgi:HD-GYP domain-containing protein (c-di-GMP phosphodiesterase class II)